MKIKLLTAALIIISSVACKKEEEKPVGNTPSTTTNTTSNTTGNTNTTNSNSTNVINDGSKSYPLKDPSASSVSNNGVPHYIHTSVKIDSVYDARSGITVRIAGGKFSTTKKTYNVGDLDTDSTQAFVSVVLIPDNRTPFKSYNSLEGTPSGTITIEPDANGIYTITGKDVTVFSGTESKTFNFSYTITPCVGCSDIPIRVIVTDSSGVFTVDGKGHPVASSNCDVKNGNQAFQITNGQSDGKLLIGLSVQFPEGQTGTLTVTTNPLSSTEAILLLTDNSISYIPSVTGSMSVTKDPSGEFTIEFNDILFEQISGTATRTVSAKFTCN